MSVGSLLTVGLSEGRIFQRLRGNRAAYTNLPEPPPTGFQYGTVTSLSPPVGGYSLETGQSPAVTIGDVFALSLTSSPGGYVAQINGDGTFQIIAGGDTSRQSLQYDLFYHSSNTLQTGGLVYVNEAAPTWASSVILALSEGVALTPLSLASPTYATSPSGDTLTFSLTTGALPAGIALSSAGVLSGTPTASGSFAGTITATDITGTGTPSSFSITVTIVNPYTLLQDAIRILVNAGFVVSQPIQYSTSATVPAGYVISQSPAAGSNVPLGTPVTLVVSTGPATSPGNTTVPTLTSTMSLVDALDLVMESGCTLAYPTFATFATSNTVANGYIISQSPAGGTVVARGTAVSVVVSVGPAVSYPADGNITVPTIPT